MVSVAEESGTVPEALHRLSPHFEEDARRALKILTSAISVVVWLFVAGVHHLLRIQSRADLHSDAQ